MYLSVPFPSHLSTSSASPSRSTTTVQTCTRSPVVTLKRTSQSLEGVWSSDRFRPRHIRVSSGDYASRSHLVTSCVGACFSATGFASFVTDLGASEERLSRKITCPRLSRANTCSRSHSAMSCHAQAPAVAWRLPTLLWVPPSDHESEVARLR